VTKIINQELWKLCKKLKKEEELQQLDAFFNPIPESTETTIDNDVFQILMLRELSTETVITPNEHVEKLIRWLLSKIMKWKKLFQIWN
jgi:D-ribose pyranose/furanose isomerase RbsD